MPWLKQHSGVSLSGTRPGSPKRRRLDDELRDRSWALARYIAHAGTKPHPFIAPTAEKMRPRVEAILQEGVDATLQRIAGASE